MSAALLRRAATVLRQHAQAATPGPWSVERNNTVFTLRSEADFEFRHESEITDVYTPDDSWPDFDFMALMHPPVALALADLLDRVVESCAITSSPPSKAFVAVARAVLREEES